MFQLTLKLSSGCVVYTESISSTTLRYSYIFKHQYYSCETFTFFL